MKLAELKKVTELEKIFDEVKSFNDNSSKYEINEKFTINLNLSIERYRYFPKTKLLKLTKIDNASIVENFSEQEVNKFINYYFSTGTFNNEIEIARKLITKGYCIVPKESILWVGGIGNFIMESKADSRFIGCKRISFNIAKFVKSKMFEEVTNNKIEQLETKLDATIKEKSRIEKELNFLTKL